jgi:hypothetical protein
VVAVLGMSFGLFSSIGSILFADSISTPGGDVVCVFPFGCLMKLASCVDFLRRSIGSQISPQRLYEQSGLIPAEVFDD